MYVADSWELVAYNTYYWKNKKQKNKKTISDI